MIKTQQSGYARNVSQKIKTISDKTTVDIIHNSENMKAFPLRSGTWLECHFYSTWYWKSKPQKIGQEKEVKVIQI